MCMYYSDSPSGKGQIEEGFGGLMNDAAREAHRMGL